VGADQAFIVCLDCESQSCEINLEYLRVQRVFATIVLSPKLSYYEWSAVYQGRKSGNQAVVPLKFDFIRSDLVGLIYEWAFLKVEG
jgi:hypothetical protein